MKDEEKLEEQLSELSERINQNPNDKVAYNNRGNLYYNLGKNAEALQDYKKAIEIDPKYKEAYYNRGNLYRNLGKNEEALQDYKKAIEIDPDFKEAYNNRGILYYNLGKNEEALQDYKKFIEIDPDDKDAYYNRGILYYNLGKKEEALQDYSQVIRIDPDCKEAYNNRGNLYRNLGKKEEALQDYNKAIEIDPEYKRAYNNRGNLYMKYKKCDESIKDFNKVIEISPNEKEKMLFYIGCVYLLKKEPENAGKKFIEAKKDMFNIITLSSNTELIKKVIAYMISDPDEHDSLKKATDSVDQNTLDLYKSIYTDILLIIRLLHVKVKKETFIAHYTTKDAAQQMLFNKSPFQLTSTLTANDSQEGKTIFHFLLQKDKIDKIKSEKNDNMAFIGCFSFNYENLNQFRLYGKNAGKDATGISLVLNENFFSSDISSDYFKSDYSNSVNENKGKEQIKEQELLPLFRCIYVDPKTSKVISLGHKEDYLLYRDEKDDKDISKYVKDLDEKKDKIVEYLKEIRKTIEENDNLDYSVISKLFLPLQYLIKHVAFKEEQECRILIIKDLSKEEAEHSPDYSRMYIKYKPITNDCLEQVIFAPKFEGEALFKEFAKQKEIDEKKFRKSDFPYV